MASQSCEPVSITRQDLVLPSPHPSLAKAKNPFPERLHFYLLRRPTLSFHHHTLFGFLTTPTRGLALTGSHSLCGFTSYPTLRSLKIPNRLKLSLTHKHHFTTVFCDHSQNEAIPYTHHSSPLTVLYLRFFRSFGQQVIRALSNNCPTLSVTLPLSSS